MFTPEFYVARSALKKGDGTVDVAAHVHADILASWNRCRRPDERRAHGTAFDFRKSPGNARVIEAAKATLSSFIASDPDSRSSIIVIDAHHRLCFRHDGDQSLKYMLNSAGMTIGSDAHESCLGTNAGYLSALRGASASVVGPEHWNDETDRHCRGGITDQRYRRIGIWGSGGDQSSLGVLTDDVLGIEVSGTTRPHIDF